MTEERRKGPARLPPGGDTSPVRRQGRLCPRGGLPGAPGSYWRMGRIIGTILGAILAIWLAFTAAGGIFATLKTLLINGPIAMAVRLVTRRPRRG